VLAFAGERSYQEVFLVLTFPSHLLATQNSKLKTHNFCASSQLLNYSTSHFVFALFAILASLVLFPQHAYCGAVTLAWDPNSPSESIAGYRLYYGTESRSYTGVIDIANGTLKKVSKLAKGYYYYFAVTAYNEAGQESDFSEELIINTCTYKLSPRRKKFKPEGGVATAKVVTQPNCEWTAASGSDWLQIMDGESGTGTGIITYSVEPNPTPEKRVADSTFGNKNFSAIQKGSTLP
jgi:hypothetical protein